MMSEAEKQLQANRRQNFRILCFVTLFLFVNGVFFPSSWDKIPWILYVLLIYAFYSMITFKNNDPLHFSLALAVHAVQIGALIMCVQLWVTSDGPSIFTLDNWHLDESQWCAVEVFMISFVVSRMGEPMLEISPYLMIIWGFIQLCFVIHIVFIWQVKGKLLFTIVTDSVIELLLEAVHNPNVFSYWLQHIVFMYSLMQMLQLICCFNLGIRLYLSTLGIVMVIAYVIEYNKFISSCLMALLAFPCKNIMTRIFKDEVIVFICITIQCMTLFEFVVSNTGLVAFLVPQDLFFRELFGDDWINPGNFSCDAPINHTNTSSSSTTSNFVMDFSAFSHLGVIVWNTLGVISGGAEITFSKWWTWDFWMNKIQFVHTLPTVTTVAWHWFLRVVYFLLKTFISNRLHFQHVIRVLSPVCTIILVERIESVEDWFHQVMNLNQALRRMQEEKINDLTWYRRVVNALKEIMRQRR